MLNDGHMSSGWSSPRAHRMNSPHGGLPQWALRCLHPVAILHRCYPLVSAGIRWMPNDPMLGISRTLDISWLKINWMYDGILKNIPKWGALWCSQVTEDLDFLKYKICCSNYSAPKGVNCAAGNGNRNIRKILSFLRARIHRKIKESLTPKPGARISWTQGGKNCTQNLLSTSDDPAAPGHEISFQTNRG